MYINVIYRYLVYICYHFGRVCCCMYVLLEGVLISAYMLFNCDTYCWKKLAENKSKYKLWFKNLEIAKTTFFILKNDLISTE